MKPFLIFCTFLIFFTLMSMVYAGGADETIDPREGCYVDIGYSGNEDAAAEADFINNRAKYLPVPDRDRYKIYTKCWEGRMTCVQTATVCRKDGVVVYKGPSWFWRDKK